MAQASTPHIGHQGHRACERAFYTSGWRSSAPSFHREEMAQRKRDADAQDAAMRKRKAELQAESDAKSAAREAEAMKRIKESEAKDRARLARCAAKGISARQCPTSASVQ
jgi:hypothetical protein